MSPFLVGVSCTAIYAAVIVGYRMTQTTPAGLRNDLATNAQKTSLGKKLQDRLGPVLLPLVRQLTTDANRARLEHHLDAAGRPDRVTIDDVLKAKGADLVVTLVVGIAAMTVLPLLLPLALLYGWFRQDLTWSSKAKLRQEQIERDLPDYLDILGVTVQAGLKFRGALRRVGDRFESPVADEFKIALQQMDVGASRRVAFEGIRQRNDSASLNRFISALLQAEELGAPLGDAMGAISKDMRKVFGQNIRKRAAKAVPKVTLVATIILVPASALLLVGGLLLGIDVDTNQLVGQ